MTSIETKSSHLSIEDDFTISVPARMVLEIAYGLENPNDVAARYGFSEESFAALCKQGYFRKQVEAKVAELKANGYTFKMKAAIAAEDLLEEVYKLSMHKNTDFDEKMDALKFFSKMADLEPKQNNAVAQGTGFSIQINFADGGMPPKRAVVEADVTDVMPTPTAEKETPADEPVPAITSKEFEIPQMTIDGQPSPGAKLLEGVNSDLSYGLPL